MVEINNFGSPLISEGVLIWTGWGRYAMPCRDDSLVIDHFGAKVADEILPTIKSLENDFYASDAKYVAVDLEEMAKLSEEHFRNKHPLVADEVVKAFVWCYTFDFK